MPFALLHLAWPALASGPLLRDCPTPEWPAAAEPTLEPVDVALEVDVGPDGSLGAVRPLRGPPPLVDALSAILPGCTVEPAEESGLPTFGVVELRYAFPPVTPRLVGTIRRRGDQSPVAGATVSAGGFSAQTDATGHFALPGLGIGAWEVAVRGLDVADQVTPVDVPPGKQVSLEILVFPSDPANVLVGTYSREPASVAQVIDLASARATPGSLGDPIRALQSSPAFSRTPFDAGWLLIRGGDWDDTSTYLDGVPVPLLYHLGGFTSVLHPEMIREVRFWPDGAPPRYADALAGSAEVIPSTGEAQRRAIVGVNVVYSEVYAATPLPDGALQVSARRSYLDAILAAALDPAAARVAPRFYDAALIAHRGNWSVLALGVSDQFDAPTGEGSETVTIAQGGGQIQARGTYGRVTVTPWVAERVQKLTDELDFQRIVEWYPGLRVEADLADRPYDVQLGAEALVHTFELVQGGDHREAPLFTGAPYAAIAGGDKLRFRTGIRGDLVLLPGQRPRFAPSPQAGVTWQFAEAWTARADWGRWHKTPDAVLLIALPDGEYLALEQADSGSAGLAWTRGPVSAQLDGFGRASRNLAGFEADGSLQGLHAWNAGVEARVGVEQEGWSASALATTVKGERWEEPGALRTLSAYDRPVRVELVGVGRLPRGALLSGRFRYTSGFPRRDEVEAFDVLTGNLVPLGTASRLPAFHSLDLKIVKPWVFRKWRLDTSLDVLNVYNHRVPEPVITGFGDSNPPIGYGLPVLPILGVSGTFWP